MYELKWPQEVYSLPDWQRSSVSITIWFESCFLNLNGASLQRPIHNHLSIILIRLKYCWKGCQNAKSSNKYSYIPLHMLFVCLFWLTSLSTIFQSYLDGVWLRQGVQWSLLYNSAASLKYHAPYTWHYTTTSRIMIYPDNGSTSPSSTRNSKCQAW